MKTLPLTPKQAAFVREYLIDLNATQAAIRAGYSERTAYRTGADNLRKPQIEAAIEAAKEQRAKKVEITAAEVVENLLQIAKGEVEYETVNGLGNEIMVQPTYRDRIKAWELIGKHLGMFTERIEAKHSFDEVLAIRVNLPKDEDAA